MSSAWTGAPLIAVVRAPRAAAIDAERMRALVTPAIGAVEIALTGEDPLELLRRARRWLPADVAVGAGTVISGALAEQALEAGASFLASPIAPPELEHLGVPVFPGVLSPTEAQLASQRGFEQLKLFPARGGPAYVRDLLGPLPGLRIYPSGGVDPASLTEWRAAGVAGAFLGSSLLWDGPRLRTADDVAARAAAAERAWSEQDQ